MSLDDEYRDLRAGTLAALITEIEMAREAGVLPPELEERAASAEREQRRRRYGDRLHLEDAPAAVVEISKERLRSYESGDGSLKNRLLASIMEAAVARDPEISIDGLIEIYESACAQMRYL